MGRYEAQEGMSAPVTTRKISYMLVDKDTVGAVREVTRLVASNPRDASYRILKGNVFDIIQMPDSALAYNKTAETFDPESGAAKLALAGYYQQHGDSVEYDNKMYEVLLVEDLDLDQKTDLTAQYLQSLINDKHETKRGAYPSSATRIPTNPACSTSPPVTARPKATSRTPRSRSRMPSTSTRPIRRSGRSS